MKSYISMKRKIDSRTNEELQKKRDVAYEVSNKPGEIYRKHHKTCNLSEMTFQNDITF